MAAAIGLDPEPRCRIGESLQVRAGAERAASAPQDRDAAVDIGLESFEGRAKVIGHLAVDGIAPLRAVHDDRRHRSEALEPDELAQARDRRRWKVAHDGLVSRVSR